MSQKIWVFVLFWVVFAYVIEMVVGFLMSFLFGMPVVWLANSNAAKILPTIALMIMGYYACKLPWDYNIRYDTANIFKAVIMNCVYVFVFFNTILMVWTEADDASDV